MSVRFDFDTSININLEFQNFRCALFAHKLGMRWNGVVEVSGIEEGIDWLDDWMQPV